MCAHLRLVINLEQLCQDAHATSLTTVKSGKEQQVNHSHLSHDSVPTDRRTQRKIGLQGVDVRAVQFRHTNPSSSALADPKTPLQYIIADLPNYTITEKRRSERTADKDVRIPGYILREPTSKSATSTSLKRKEPLFDSAQNGSIYNWNTVKAPKKDDGEPHWRKDIQYKFSRLCSKTTMLSSQARIKLSRQLLPTSTSILWLGVG